MLVSYLHDEGILAVSLPTLHIPFSFVIAHPHLHAMCPPAYYTESQKLKPFISLKFIPCSDNASVKYFHSSRI